MSHENVELVREFYAGWARGDFSVGADLSSPDYEYQQLASSVEPGLRRGAGVGRALRGIFDVYDKVRIEAEEYIDAGDSVVVVARMFGTARESQMDLDQRFAFVWVIEGSRVVRTEVYPDRREALEAAGLPD
jgi:ketosteroid isomerase-like protein